MSRTILGTHPVYFSVGIGLFLGGCRGGGVKFTAWLRLMLLYAFVAGAGMDCFDGILFLSTHL